MIEPLVLFLLAPFALFPSPTRFVAVLAIPALWVWRWKRSRHFLPRTPLDGALLLLALMVLVSEWATYDIAVSLPKIAGMVFGIGAYYGVVQACRGTRAWLSGLGVLALAGVGVAGLGLLGTKWIAKFGFLNPIIALFPARLTGLPGAPEGFQPNEVAGTLLWVVPLCLALSVAVVIEARRLRQTLGKFGSSLFSLLVVGTALFAGAVLVLTQSRSGLLGFAAALLLMPLLAGRKLRGAALLLLAVCLLAATIGFAYFGPERLLSVLAGPSLQTGDALALDTLNGRLEIWSRAIYGIQDFPFTGMGMNTFRTVVHVLYPLFLISPDMDIGHAHNTWLQVALDLGLPGLVAYAAVWLLSIKMLLDVMKSTADPLARAASIGMLGSLAGYFVYGLTDTVALGAKPGFMFWMLLGLAVATWNLAVPVPPAAPRT